MSKKCELCGGTGEVVNRPSRLIGATYLDNNLGDEKLEPCPICSLLVNSLSSLRKRPEVKGN